MLDVTREEYENTPLANRAVHRTMIPCHWWYQYHRVVSTIVLDCTTFGIGPQKWFSTLKKIGVSYQRKLNALEPPFAGIYTHN